MSSLSRSRRRRLVALMLAAVASPAAAQPARPDGGLSRLEAHFAELAKSAGGTVGVAVVHVESGRAAYLNRGVAFPLASTVKMAIATQLLTRVDRGEVRLDSMITVRPVDLRPGGTLSETFGAPSVTQPGVALSVRNLMEVMFRVSDNTAADVLRRTAGGVSAVTARLAELGVTGMHADRSTLHVMADYGGIQGLQGEEVTPAEFVRLSRAVTDSGRAAAMAAFFADPRDTTTPEAMATLLAKIARREALSAQSTTLLLAMMLRSTTGPERIKGMLPPGTRVSHKTGTLGPPERWGGRGGFVVNDVGIVDLPAGAGHVVVAAYVKDAAGEASAERAIAHIARAAYDYFLLAAP